MNDDYQIPAIALIAALMLAFAYLHLRFRSVRTLLWILALGCAELQTILLWLVARTAGGASSPSTIWMSAAGETALMISSALFLASLSPVTFRLGRFQILYVVPYTIPLLLYSFLYYGTHLNPHLTAAQHPTGPFPWLYCFLAVWAAVAALFWSTQKSRIPVWIATTLVASAIILRIPDFVNGNVYMPLLVLESGNMLMTALLVLYTFPRVSPGVLLTSFGFMAWALPSFFMLQSAGSAEMSPTVLARIVLLGKVVVAMGLVLLVLEEEVDKNESAQKRERRVRLELEAYARQALGARSLEEFDRDSGELCEMIVEHSLFASAAMVVRGANSNYNLVGYAGMDGATAGALDSLAQRLPPTCFAPALEPEEAPAPDSPQSQAQHKTLVPGSSSLDLDLHPWLTPGDDLERMHLTRVGAVPMLGPDNTPEGALLLTGLRVPAHTLRADDLLPIEVLAGRLQAARAQAMMLGKLIESERFAGVGQLATNVAQQLHNPLTVILGYSALLEESNSKGPGVGSGAGMDHRGIEAISLEARRMKNILERLSRFSRLSTERFNAFSVADLIADIEQLHRTDFLRHSIEFRLNAPSTLPNIFGNAHQIRQALLHAMQFAIEGAIRVGPNQEKAVRIEASSEDSHVMILIGHSGQGFPHPDRVFDSLATGFAGSEASGIGLSLCAAIVREHRGNISAVNYQPTGAAVIMDLPVS
jgi:two-component system NtrC family sensor kinase